MHDYDVDMDTVKPILHPQHEGDPVLAFTYAPVPDLDELTEEVVVQVTVKIDGDDMTAKSEFKWQKCDECDCTNADDPNEKTDYEYGQFYVHLNTGFLKITKALASGTSADPSQSYLFRIEGMGDSDYEMTVVISGTGSVTISDIPSGSYTVTEDSTWSWRYEAETVSVKVGSGSASTYSSTTGAAVTSGQTTEVTFTNRLSDSKWLSGDCWCDNWFTQTAETKERAYEE